MNGLETRLEDATKALTKKSSPLTQDQVERYSEQLDDILEVADGEGDLSDGTGEVVLKKKMVS